MFKIVENPVLSPGDYFLYSPLCIFQEPKGFPKTKETVLRKSLGVGEKDILITLLFPLMVLLQPCN